MFKSKSEFLFLILSIVLLVITGTVYTMTSRSRQEQEVTQVSHSSSSEATKLKEAAEKAIKALEENPNQDTLKKAKEAVNKLPNGDFKNQLQEQINTIEANLKQEELAETAVTTAESTLLAADIETAQADVNQLKDGDKKTALQKRLDDLRAALNIQASVVEPTPPAEPTQATETVEYVEVLEPTYQPEPYAPAVSETPAVEANVEAPESNNVNSTETP